MLPATDQLFRAAPNAFCYDNKGSTRHSFKRHQSEDIVFGGYTKILSKYAARFACEANKPTTFLNRGCGPARTLLFCTPHAAPRLQRQNLRPLVLRPERSDRKVDAFPFYNQGIAVVKLKGHFSSLTHPTYRLIQQSCIDESAK